MVKKVDLTSRITAVPGLAFHTNPKNEFLVIELDFVADPEKAPREWAERESKKYPPKQWAVEMERSWETYAGRPVYEHAFNKRLHVLTSPIGADPGYPIFRGWDFGGNQSVAICQIIGTRLIVLDELANGGLNTRKFAPEVIAFCNNTYGSEYHYVDIVDPSSFWEGKTSEGRACTDVMRDYDLEPIPAPTNDPTKRTDAVMMLLMSLSEGMPALQLNPQCTVLIGGFDGGYHFPDKPTQGRRMDRPVKNLYSHIHDGLQYVALRMKQHKHDRDESVEYEHALTNTSRYQFTKKR